MLLNHDKPLLTLGPNPDPTKWVQIPPSQISILSSDQPANPDLGWWSASWDKYLEYTFIFYGDLESVKARMLFRWNQSFDYFVFTRMHLFPPDSGTIREVCEYCSGKKRLLLETEWEIPIETACPGCKGVGYKELRPPEKSDEPDEILTPRSQRDREAQLMQEFDQDVLCLEARAADQ